VDYYQIIARRFQSTMENIAMSVDQLAGPMGEASELMTQTLLQDGKIICCGNGVDASQAQFFTTCLLTGLEDERPALPALHLSGDAATITAIATGDGLGDIYSRQIRACAQEGDLLLLLNSARADNSLILAMEASRERNMGLVALSNRGDDILGAGAQPGDVVLNVDAATRAQVIELQTMVLHGLCQLIEYGLFGGHEWQ